MDPKSTFFVVCLISVYQITMYSLSHNYLCHRLYTCVALALCVSTCVFSYHSAVERVCHTHYTCIYSCPVNSTWSSKY